MYTSKQKFRLDNIRGSQWRHFKQFRLNAFSVLVYEYMKTFTNTK